ncbi:alpha/beta hydrolase [Nocardia harenae]|uniref:alpha/beta hydrolase n=1 Tax=Nocardia harenae TaxID=358707 RepID=UPI000ABB878B|nr:alpha/beta hydrolase family protein [Nocardia harenae]
MRGSALRRCCAGAVVTLTLATGAAVAQAAPDSGSAATPAPKPVEQSTATPPTTPAIRRIEPVDDRRVRVFVDSPAMQREVEVIVLLPRDRSQPRPTVYMLDGRSAEPDTNNWLEKGRAAEFYEDKPVNVVFTVGGPASFYTDWQQPDPVLGLNRWETFLTAELPPAIDARFNGNGWNAVSGVSMGAEAATMLAIRHPGLYRSVAGYSGCFSMGTDLGQAEARAVIATYGGDPDNMFGPSEHPDWLQHDVVLHAEALRGKAIYLSAGSGIPGVYDGPDNPDYPGNIGLGGPLEAGTGNCTRRLTARLQELGIGVTTHFRATGTHSWPYWADELEVSWPTVAAGLGL